MHVIFMEISAELCAVYYLRICYYVIIVYFTLTLVFIFSTFFSGVKQSLSSAVREEEIGFQINYSRSVLKGILKQYPLKEVRKSIEHTLGKVPLPHLFTVEARYVFLRVMTNSFLLHSTLLHSTPLYSTLLYSTLLYSTPPYSTLLYSTLFVSILLCPILLYSALLYSTLLYPALLCPLCSTLLSSALL